MREISLGLNEFREFIVPKKVLCYGGGISGLRTINIMENWGKERDVLAFIDRDKNKWDKTISLGELSYPIISLDKALGIVNENTVILITCTEYPTDIIEIKKMLNGYSGLENIACFSWIEIAQTQLCHSDYKEIIRESEQIIIPKKIHYCWFGGKKPAFIEKTIDSWRAICPDYEIVEWNETNYDFVKNSYMKQAYEAKAWGFVPDYARIDIIYNYGGVYIDTDVRILKKLDDLLYQKNFFISDGEFLVNLGSGFGAIAGEPVLKELMDYYDNISFRMEDGSFNKLAAPMHQYNILRKYGFKINDELQTINNVNIYPMILGGTCPYTMQIRKSNKAFLAHYGTATWKNSKVLESRKKFRSNVNIDGLEDYDIDML